MTQTSDALEILDRMIGDDESLRAMIAEEEHKLAIAQLVYDARHQAGLTQRELAALVGTRQPAIARLEDADYGSQSLTMLYRIATALGRRLEVKFVPREGVAEARKGQHVTLPPSEIAENWAEGAKPAASFRLQGAFSPQPQSGGYKLSGTLA